MSDTKAESVLFGGCALSLIIIGLSIAALFAGAAIYVLRLAFG